MNPNALKNHDLINPNLTYYDCEDSSKCGLQITKLGRWLATSQLNIEAKLLAAVLVVGCVSAAFVEENPNYPRDYPRDTRDFPSGDGSMTSFSASHTSSQPTARPLEQCKTMGNAHGALTMTLLMWILLFIAAHRVHRTLLRHAIFTFEFGCYFASAVRATAGLVATGVVWCREPSLNSVLNSLFYSTCCLVQCYVLLASDVAPWMRHIKPLSALVTLILCTFGWYVLLTSEEMPDIENRDHRFHVPTWPVAGTPRQHTLGGLLVVAVFQLSHLLALVSGHQFPLIRAVYMHAHDGDGFLKEYLRELQGLRERE